MFLELSVTSFVFKSVCLITLLLLLNTFNYTAKKKLYKDITSKLPTAYGLPYIGIVYKIIPFRKFLYAIAAQFEEFKTLTYCAWLGTEPYIITTDPDIIKSVLNSENFINRANTLYHCIDHAIPGGLITSRESKWKSNRKLLNPSYSHKTILSFIDTFNSGSRRIVKLLEQFVDSGEHKLLEIIRRTVFQTAIETNLGFSFREDNALDETFYEDFKVLLHNAARDSEYTAVRANFLIRNNQYYRIKSQLRQYIKNHINSVIDFEDTVKKDVNNNNNICDFEKPKNGETFIQRAIELLSSGHFNMDDIISEAHTLLAGSFETISTTVFSVIVMLAMHTEEQEKLFEEIQAVCDKTEGSVGYEQLKNMPYLDMIVNETIRLIPAIPTIGRETISSSFLKDDICLPAKMQIIIPIFALHRNKILWGPKADYFNPENFYPENIARRHPYAYLPFSKGPRNCIGWHYGIVAVKIFLIHLCKNYKFSTNFKYNDLVFIHNISIRYYREPKLKIERR